MGIADIIPGVSGGTIAFITGIYERFVFGIRDIDFKFVPLAVKGKMPEAKENFKSIDFRFFIPLLCGMGLAFLIFSKIVHFALVSFPVPTFAFFFGLILASSRMIFLKIKEKRALALGFVVLGAIAGFAFTQINPIQADNSPLIIILSGMIAITAMVLPGISGAFILLMLGKYEFIVQAVTNFDLYILVLFNIGSISGIIVFSRILSYMLKKYFPQMIGFLTGLMLGGLAVPLEKISLGVGETGLIQPLLGMLAGLVVVLLLEWVTSKKKPVKEKK